MILLVTAVLTLNVSAFDLAGKIIEPLVETVCNLMKDCVEFLTDGILSTFSMDLDTFYNGFPFVQAIRGAIAKIAFLMMFLVLIVSLVRQFMEPLGFKSESPIRLVMNTLVLAPVVYYGREIADWIISLSKEPYQWLWGVDYRITVTYSTAEAIAKVVEVILSTAAGLVTTTVGLVITIVVLFIIAKNFLAFAAEIAERYIVLGFLVICAPLALAFMPSESTRGITGSWFKMLLGQVVMLILDALIMRMFQSSVAMAGAII